MGKQPSWKAGKSPINALFILALSLFISSLVYFYYSSPKARAKSHLPKTEYAVLAQNSGLHFSQSGKREQDSLQQQLQNSSFLVVIMIPVGFARHERDVMRETWLQYTNVFHPALRPSGSFRPFFLIGAQDLSPEELAKVTTEGKEHDDLWIGPKYPLPDHGTKLMGFMSWLVRDSGLQFQALLKADVDTFVRTELFELKVKELVANKQKSNEHKPFVFGLQSAYHQDVCGAPRPDLVFNSGACWLVDSEIVNWWAQSSAFSENIKWCSDIEDIRSGLWISQFQAFNRSAKWERGRYQITVTDPPDNYERGHPLVFHYAQAKKHLEKYHRYLFKYFPPRTDFAGKGWSWTKWRQMVIVDELTRQMGHGGPQNEAERNWSDEQLKHEYIPGVVTVGICSSSPSVFPSSIDVDALDLNKFWKVVMSLVFPNRTIVFYNLEGNGKLLTNNVKLDFVICEGFSYNTSIFNRTDSQKHTRERPFLIAHNSDEATNECIVDLVLQWSSSKYTDKKCSLIVPRALVALGYFLHASPSSLTARKSIPDISKRKFGLFAADNNTVCNKDVVVSLAAVRSFGEKDHIDILGQCKNNFVLSLPPANDTDALLLMFASYKFVFIPSSSSTTHQSDVSDKILLALLAQAIPIVFGAAHDIGEMFNTQKLVTFETSIQEKRRIQEIWNQKSSSNDDVIERVQELLANTLKQTVTNVNRLNAQDDLYLEAVTGPFSSRRALFDLRTVASELKSRLWAAQSYLVRE